MDDQRSNGINLSIRAKDSRYLIPVYLDDDAEPTFSVRFNPNDILVLDYVEALQNLDISVIGSGLTSELKKNLDAIFGEGSAQLICRYNGADNALMNALLEKVREGYDDFKEKAEETAKAAKLAAVLEAKKNAAPYIAPTK